MVFRKAGEENNAGGMFSRTKPEQDCGDASKNEPYPRIPSVIQRKTYEQIELERLSENVEEIRQSVLDLQESITRAVKEELRSFHSKFETWQDIKRIQEDLERRERELSIREQALKLKQEETANHQ
jgi:signal transduction protein with GAF and PtsI domain